MKIRNQLKNLWIIIPENKHRSLFWFLIKNILYGVLDLVSIAYLIPVIILFFDQKKFNLLIAKMPLIKEFLLTSNIQIVTATFVVLYFLKIVFQTRFTASMYLFLFDLSTDLSVKNTNIFINKSFLQQQKINKGTIQQHVTNIPEDFSIRYLLSIINLVSESIVLTILTSVLLLFYFKIISISLLILLIFAFVIFISKKRQMSLINNVYYTAQSKANDAIINLIDGYLEIKNCSNYSFFLAKFKNEKALLNAVTAKLVAYNVNYAKYLEIVFIVCIAVFSLFQFNKINTIITISILGASSLRLIPSISRILNALTLINTYKYSAKTLVDNQKIEVQNKISAFDSDIKLENICFSYDQNVLITNLNLNIKKGDFLLIKGDSGVGKTTLLYIILGIIAPKKGAYYLDNLKIKSPSVLEFASYVPQQPFLFSGSIIDNIVMGQKKELIDYKYIYYLCKKLNLDNTIAEMSHHYETQIGHDSMRLSGGQKQRLAIVRALYSKPSAVILDEATNQQDKMQESNVFEFLKFLQNESNLTVIAVSHNPNLTEYFSSFYNLNAKI